MKNGILRHKKWDKRITNSINYIIILESQLEKKAREVQ